MAEQFDVIVLGAGSGGLSVAQRAARHGAQVALLDPDLVGGTCVNRGCVPKKAMWSAAQIVGLQRLAREIGFSGDDLQLDWARFRQLRDRYIAGIRNRYLDKLTHRGITLIHAAGELLGEQKVRVADGRVLQAEHIVIATGARPQRLDLPGFELGMVSDDIFELDAAPRTVGIVGGGYVAVEFACLLNELGSKVELIVQGELLAPFDRELAQILAERMSEHGIRIVRDTSIKSASGEPGAITLHSAQTQSFGAYDAVLWAVGRRPNSDRIGLQQAGVTCDERGHIKVDAQQNTNVLGIYAVGDVTPLKALTPVAVAAGHVLGNRLFGKQPDAYFDPQIVPSVIFADPPMGSVGLTEAQAREKYGDQIGIHRGHYTPLISMVAGRKEDNVVKVLCAGAEQRVIGIHVLGPGCDEYLQGFAVAMQKGLCVRDLQDAIAIHPTAAEELLALD